MSATAGSVLEDFKTRIEALAPTHAAPQRKFIWYDGDRLHADQSAGMTRAFRVLWLGSESPLSVEDAAQQYREHDFLVEVAYSTQYELLQRQQIMLSDGFDIIKTLRASYPTGCDTRILIRDERVTEGQTEYYRQRWRCAIPEVE